MRTKPRRHRGRFIDAQMSNWPVTPRVDLNLGSVRFFVVVVGRIVVFIVVPLFGVFSLFCLSQRYCPKSDPRLRGKFGKPRMTRIDGVAFEVNQWIHMVLPFFPPLSWFLGLRVRKRRRTSGESPLLIRIR